jgi:hypothetical protein
MDRGTEAIRMNPILDKLTGRPRSLVDVADTLERHIGDGTDESRCKEAMQALQRVRLHNPTYYLRAALRELDYKAAPCEVVRRVIRVLRKWRHYSGT